MNQRIRLKPFPWYGFQSETKKELKTLIWKPAWVNEWKNGKEKFVLPLFAPMLWDAENWLSVLWYLTSAISDSMIVVSEQPFCKNKLWSPHLGQIGDLVGLRVLAKKFNDLLYTMRRTIHSIWESIVNSLDSSFILIPEEIFQSRPPRANFSKDRK